MLRWIHICVLVIFSLTIAHIAQAQTDEIQVYDAGIADVGQFEATVHSNFAPDGLKKPSFPGATVSNQSFNGTLETAYGVTPWWELGLYLPVYSIANDGPQFNGAKLRTLFVKPDAAHQTFFYGVNFELSFNNKHWEANSPSLEMRPIVGLHLGPWDLIWNPIVDSGFTGAGKAEFNPAARIAYNFNETYAVALEHYAGYGALDKLSLNHSYQEAFLAGDYRLDESNSFEAGVGLGLNSSSDPLLLKLIVNHSF